MAKFNFRLQGYLNVKEKLEGQRKMEYGQMLQALEKEKANLFMLESEKAQCLGLFKLTISSGKKGLDPEEMKRYNSYLSRIAAMINRQSAKVAEAESSAEKKRLELLEAMKERKMLDTLKDKARAVYNRQELLDEQKAADEIVSSRFKKNARL
ncbi:MAG: flagellar export protein FliJ [Clostridiales bacterium]|nr:flagellar export protein FliJ [Clostridiales bacterium]